MGIALAVKGPGFNPRLGNHKPCSVNYNAHTMFNLFHVYFVYYYYWIQIKSHCTILKFDDWKNVIIKNSECTPDPVNYTICAIADYILPVLSIKMILCKTPLFSNVNLFIMKCLKNIIKYHIHIKSVLSSLTLWHGEFGTLPTFFTDQHLTRPASDQVYK